MYPDQVGYALAQRRCDPKWLGGLLGWSNFVVARAWSVAEAAEITETDEDRITVSEPSTSLQKRYLFHFSRGPDVFQPEIELCRRGVPEGSCAA